ncbi:hypothetical protein, partial [Klebsiella pneumoniae]|uniref:hypothetical protein n=1 Tax=Klebsiella pneumoniae TaxID=573 RepID=UPI003A8084C0
MVYIFCRDQDLFTPVLIKFLRQTVLIYSLALIIALREGANKQVISSQADSLIKISRIWADF